MRLAVAELVRDLRDRLAVHVAAEPEHEPVGLLGQQVLPRRDEHARQLRRVDVDLFDLVRVDADRLEVIGELVEPLLRPAPAGIIGVRAHVRRHLVLHPCRLERDRQLAERQKADRLAVDVDADVFPPRHAGLELGRDPIVVLLIALGRVLGLLVVLDLIHLVADGLDRLRARRCVGDDGGDRRRCRCRIGLGCGALGILAGDESDQCAERDEVPHTEDDLIVRAAYSTRNRSRQPSLVEVWTHHVWGTCSQHLGDSRSRKQRLRPGTSVALRFWPWFRKLRHAFSLAC